MTSKAATTRLNILQKAFTLVYKNGYKATSIDEIIATTQVTKGAFFYHFKNKDEMGIAMISEVLYPGMQEALVKPIEEAKNPKKELYLMMHSLLMNNTFFVVNYGCPAINLIEEMSSYNDEFSLALKQLSDSWKKAIVNTIEKGKETGTIKPEANNEAVAIYIMSSYAGIRNLGKLYGKEHYTLFLEQFKAYTEIL